MPAVDRRARRGGGKALPPEQLRTHCVSVRLSAAELEQLDARRGELQRGEWLRVAALDVLPPVIPELNREAWIELARAAANLNQLAFRTNTGATPEIEEAIRAQPDFQAAWTDRIRLEAQKVGGQAALQVAERLRQQYPDAMPGDLVVCDLQMAVNRFPEARTA